MKSLTWMMALSLLLTACTQEDKTVEDTTLAMDTAVQDSAEPDTRDTTLADSEDAAVDTEAPDTEPLPDADDLHDAPDDTPSVSCDAGFADCDNDPANGCETALQVDASHCGACGAACESGQVCDGTGTCAVTCGPGLVNCSGTCVDTGADLSRISFRDCIDRP